MEDFQVSIRPLTDIELARRACEATVDREFTSSITIERLAKMEHSPLRCLLYWVELVGIPTQVSVHLVRHNQGVDHFVSSKRSDRRTDKSEVVDRDTPVTHCMLINAQALVNMGRKRLCPASAKETVKVYRYLRKEMLKVEPEFGVFLVPECVYRGGICPEAREGDAGVVGMMQAYKEYPQSTNKNRRVL